MAKQSRRWIPRSIKLVPAAMVSAIVLAVMSLLGLLNFNIGAPSVSMQALNTDSSSERSSPAEQAEAVAPRSSTTDARPDSSVPSTLVVEDSGNTEELANPTVLADVLIDGDVYELGLQRSDGEIVREARSLAEIVELALELPGDAAGVRIRISRRFAATARADRGLLEALLAAGLTEDEIDHRRTLVD